jgi:hypothetical protein
MFSGKCDCRCRFASLTVHSPFLLLTPLRRGPDVQRAAYAVVPRKSRNCQVFLSDLISCSGYTDKLFRDHGCATNSDCLDSVNASTGIMKATNSICLLSRRTSRRASLEEAGFGQLFRGYSITRLNAACRRFFTFTQRSNRPPRYGLSRCFDTGPFQPPSGRHAGTGRADLALLERCRVDAFRSARQQPRLGTSVRRLPVIGSVGLYRWDATAEAGIQRIVA